MSENSSPIQLNKSDFYNCRGCVGGASKLGFGRVHIFKKEDIKCNKCIEKKCGSCEENEKVDFAVPYQLPIDQEYYEDFFTGRNVPWFSDGVEEGVKRRTEGKHPSIIREIVGNGTVLDSGCGQAWLVGFLRELGVEAYGIDYSEYAIVNSFYLARPFVSLGDIQKLPYEDNSFNMVIAREVFEHLTIEQAINALHEMDRVCKPGGLLYFTIWLNFYQQDNVSPDILCKDVRDPSHVTFMPRKFWLRLFENNLSNIEYETEISDRLDWMEKSRTFVYRKI